ncbi:tetratricopeptide repeat domain protein [Aspergillus fischeri NRRL 181]|uniref:Tetratricopeptide repeat domain protein n=1 Tax=Neosartorya fischeri (strain ATCC 1020 / DSM 3700 / CBS 544.65 / FGSC A1164 / JCM 1740 / NRRL 181 / WB 181) TaxID=331117 RepID=A1D8Z4_NEOFI|nr:tetratricopeptide repeat domain protein [Aspergillus fischeri NRRL 181]EAW20855.1 tetratricopeptide repeat domain protein [Aspergillus fischeri NRRL 181]
MTLVSLGILHLHELSPDHETNSEAEWKNAVDIVAVHGLNEDSITAWSAPETGTLWLKDLIPKHIPQARVLSFGYESSPSRFDGPGFVDKIRSLATTLVADLEADRSLGVCRTRPIIFVCHGLGGVIVKKALAHSASSTSPLVAHLNEIFISTFAILFFGTPHININLANWLVLESSGVGDGRAQRPGYSQSSPPKKLQSLESITDQFAPLMKKFYTTFFWEGMPTDFGGYHDFLVEPASAAPAIYESPKCAIVGATHSRMVKLLEWSPSYSTVLATLKRYCLKAPGVINDRWKKARDALARARLNEAHEMAGFRFSLPDKLADHVIKNISKQEARNQHLYTPLLPSVNYIGRKEIREQIRQALLLPETEFIRQSQRRLIVHGIAGSGKSQLCTNFASDNRESYWGIFTIDATSEALAAKSYAEIGKIGGLASTESAGKHYLSQAREPWLLIIDNADSPELHLPSLFPPGDRGHILVTTRNREIQRYGNVGSIELGKLGEEEALYLLLNSAEISPPWDKSTETKGKEIAKILGYLALAIKQAGSAISRKLCNLEDYLAFYQYYRKKRKQKASIASSSAREDIYSAFDLSFEHLDKKQTSTSQDAIEILNIVSFFHFDNIRIEIFESAMRNRRTAQAPSSLISRLQAPRPFPHFLKRASEDTDIYYLRVVLCELYTLSLIGYDEDLKSFRLHPLIHAWARDRIDPKERKIWALLALNTLVEAILLPSDDHKGLDTDLGKDILPHLDECLAACPVEIERFSIPFGRLGIQVAKLIMATHFLNLKDKAETAARCGYVYALCGRFADAARYITMVKDLTVQTLGYDNPRTQMAMMGLANVLWGLGKLEQGIALQKRVVEVRQKWLGSSHRDTLKAMATLGQSLWLNGQYLESLQLLEKTTEKMIDTLGSEDRDTLVVMDNLGVTLGSWQRYEESRAMHERVLRVRQRDAEEDDIDTLTTMSNLAMALLDLGELEQAKEMMSRVYKLRQKKLGKEHPYTLWALCYLSKIYTELGLLDQAERMLEDGIAAGKRSLSEDHLGVLMGCGELARVYARQGRLEEAERLSLSVLQKVKVTRGSEHFDYIFGMWKLGQLYEKKNQVREALDAYRVAFEHTETRLTREHPLAKQIELRIDQLNSSISTNPETTNIKEDHTY